MNHFIPTEFATAAKDLLTLPLANRMNDSAVVPATPSNALVEVGLITAPGKGSILPCINWAGQPLANFSVSMNFAIKFTKASLSSGKPLTATKGGNGFPAFSFDLYGICV
jgi:hypothetical protein